MSERAQHDEQGDSCLSLMLQQCISTLARNLEHGRMSDQEHRQRTIESLRRDLTRTEIKHMLALLETGVFHLQLAIEAFDGMSHGTDTEDLRALLEKALEVKPVLLEAADGQS